MAFFLNVLVKVKCAFIGFINGFSENGMHVIMDPAPPWDPFAPLPTLFASETVCDTHNFPFFKKKIIQYFFFY